ncbi:hypothetical protein [Halochromatium roseum]|uniref:hypothetical protein n=1 Tax=Halochromatium roseum TaxID=391920 RepID=UPI0019132CD4|nr:hypothetical protein [Halochromatium roseum]MBK5941424.1 hypothetical protein [Halochromatium roseum]
MTDITQEAIDEGDTMHAIIKDTLEQIAGDGELTDEQRNRARRVLAGLHQLEEALIDMLERGERLPAA